MKEFLKELRQHMRPAKIKNITLSVPMLTTRKKFLRGFAYTLPLQALVKTGARITCKLLHALPHNRIEKLTKSVSPIFMPNSEHFLDTANLCFILL